MQDQGNLTELTVSELSQALKRVVETTFDFVRVRGEISGFKRAASGHVYLTLKDDRAVIDGVCWRGQAARLDCRPEDGLDVVVTGKLTTYPGRSKYQIVIETMQLAGLGALMKLFEERKQKLAEEGLFDSDRKKKIPFLPERIGVVTSPTGAVIRDILHRLNERFPRHVLVWPVLVQGEGSAQQIAAAIQGFNDLPPIERPDLVIVARGGGSIEDLWAFNEEIVVRAAFASRIPLISAVGHETDTTLIDFASDLRAPTPTAAAEIAVPVRRDLIATVEQAGMRLTNGVNRFFDGLDRHLTGLARGLPAPTLLIGHAQQRLDDQSERLRLALTTHMRQGRSRLLERAAKLVSPRQMLTFAQKQLKSQAQQLDARLPQRLERLRERLTSQSNLFESLSHKRVLDRGYALVRRPSDGTLVAKARDALVERRLSLTFQDGEIEVSPSEKTDGHGKPAKEAGETGRQGRLL